MLAVSTRPVLAQLHYPVPKCNQPPSYDYTIGNPKEVKVYSGNYTFPAGVYHVTGNLYFTNGTFTIQPNTTFYIDGISGRAASYKPLVVTGYSLTLGSGATINANGAVFNAACDNNMWKGFIFENPQSNQPSQTDQVLNLTNCGVANAEYGVLASSYCEKATYNINNCHFEQNLYHVVDAGYHTTGPNIATCTIEDSYFLSQPYLLRPYDVATTKGLETWTYEALRLTPRGNADGRPKVLLLGNNTINGAIYGLVANVPGQAQIYGDNGALNIRRVVRTGIWLDLIKESILHFPSPIDINMSGGVTITDRSYRTYWTAPAEPMYGLVAASNGGYVGNPGTNYLNLNIAGVSADTTTHRTQTGLFLNEVYAPLVGVTLTNLAYGMSLQSGSGLVTGNTFANCLHGLRIRPNSSATVNFDVSCNSFSGPSDPTSSGIYINSQATFNDQGTLDYPVGNTFSGYGTTGTRSIVNDGTNGVLKYYRFASAPTEQIDAIIRNSSASNPQIRGMVTSTYPNQDPTSSPTNYCLYKQNVFTGVQSRGTSRATLMQALMDTLRRQAAPTARLGRYQAAIREWLLQEEPDTAALDAYVRLLPATSPQAFWGLGLDLLEQYRRTGRRRLAAALHPVLAARTATNPAARARLALSDVLSRLGQSGASPLPGQSELTALDSLTLRRLASTPSGTAETAALWFNYLYPGVGLRAAAARPEASGSPVAASAKLATIQALYPNPTADQLHVEVATPTGTAALRLTDLMSGKTLVQKELDRSAKGMSQADVNVRGLPAGQYAATVLVDGVPVATQKVLINR